MKKLRLFTINALLLSALAVLSVSCDDDKTITTGGEIPELVGTWDVYEVHLSSTWKGEDGQDVVDERTYPIDKGSFTITLNKDGSFAWYDRNMYAIGVRSLEEYYTSYGTWSSTASSLTFIFDENQENVDRRKLICDMDKLTATDLIFSETDTFYSLDDYKDTLIEHMRWSAKKR